MSKPLTDLEKEAIRNRVENGLDSQFEMYSWENMLDDLGLTRREKLYAMELTYVVREIAK